MAGGTCTNRSNGAAFATKPFASLAGWLQGSGSGSAAVLMALRRRRIHPSRGRWFQLRGISTASRLPGAVEMKSLSSLKEKTSEIPMAKFVQLCCQAIGSFFNTLHEPMAVQFHCVIE